MSEVKQKSLPEGNDLFFQTWERSVELRDILDRLPGRSVMKAGMAGERHKLLSEWSELDSPDIDGSISDSALSDLEDWISSSEKVIGLILNFKKSDLYDEDEENVHDIELVSSINELDFVNDSWSYPWDIMDNKISTLKKISDERKTEKSRLVKYGIIGVAGLLLMNALTEEEDS